jgi:hypothetical protein
MNKEMKDKLHAESLDPSFPCSSIVEWLEEIEKRIYDRNLSISSIEDEIKKKADMENEPSCKNIVDLIESILSLKKNMVELKDAIDYLRVYKSVHYESEIARLERKIKDLEAKTEV